MTGSGEAAASWAASRRAFGSAAEWFLTTAALVGDRWDLPGLGEWDVRALVGHTSRAMLTVEAYLARRAARVELPSAVAYYQTTSALAAAPEVAQRGRDAGVALGSDPSAAVAEIAARVLPIVAACDGAELVTTIAGGMRLSDYLPTRTFELTVHTADLAVALGLPAEPPAVAARAALTLVAELAINAGLAGQLLLAATGRGGLPTGYTVL